MKHMTKSNFAAAVLAASSVVVLAFSPALAQRSAVQPGNYWEVSDIKTEPGQSENYADYLKTKWRAQQEFAKSKGYILDYHVLSNAYPRADEPDLFLVVIFKDWPSNAEAQRRQDEFVAMMKADEHALAAASGQRGPMRKLLGQSLLQEMEFTK
jgi:hypothetical protein